MDAGFLNVGFGELMWILILAGVILGPQRIRIVARWLGVAISKLRGVSTQFMRQLNSELDDSGREDLKGALDDIRGLQKELRDLRREVYSGTKSVFTEEKRKFEQLDQPNNTNGTSDVAIPDNQIGGSISTLPSIVDIEDDPE